MALVMTHSMVKGKFKHSLIRFSVLIAAIFILLSTGNAHSLQWQVYGLSQNSQSPLFCSATLIKKDNICRLLTAAHCLDNQAQKVTVRGHNKAVLAQADVVAIDRSKDLAWLKSNTINNHCSQIQEVGDQRMFGRENHYSRYFSYGVTNSGLIQLDLWEKTKSAGPLKTKTVVKGQPGLEYTIAIKPLELVKGMSGGVLTDDRGDFLGINSQYEPSKDTSYFIPVEEVVKYLQSPTDLRSLPVQGMQRFENVGGNNHGNSNDGKKSASWRDQIKEMDEGVVESDGRVLIGRGGFSVDGVDKWALTQKMVNPIYREADGYPRLEIRQNILKRLNGIFRSRATSIDMKFLDIAGTTLNPTGVQLQHSLHVQVSSSTIKVYFPFGLDLKSAPVTVGWSVQFSQDYKTITLTNPQSKLVCNNNNYLKLICRSEDEELTISHPDVFDDIEIRWYKKINASQLMFTFGKLYGSN